MKISVIVVSHNMCSTLRQSLTALTKATDKLDSEIILVDTGSEDDTVLSVMKNFPDVRVTTSDYSRGCAKAVNQGIRMSQGDLVLVMKPDVMVQSDSVRKAAEFMEQHPSAGGMGVRMLDREGNYLRASKKVLPNAWITFFRLTGLLKQFPKSRLRDNFRNHSEEEFDTTEVDVLGSSFMLLRKSILDTIGLFDERFISYGGNIDLSYRIRLAGFKNFYYPKTYIINRQANKVSRFSWQHLKGFYGAMFIFVIKYFFSLPALHVKPLQEMYPAYELKG